MIGPQVAFVDDEESQITIIKNELIKRNTGTIFFDATPEISTQPDKPIETIEILFLDLYYGSSVFDVDMSAQWVQEIIPENKKYVLVVWSRDTQNHTQELLEVLNEINLTPTYLEEWQKTDLDLNVPERLNSLINHISEISSEIVLGEIVDVEADGVLINCRLNEEVASFQVRRFDLELLSNIKSISIGMYVRIHIYTKPGARLIDIFEEKNDLSDKFIGRDFFEGLEDSPFFKGE